MTKNKDEMRQEKYLLVIQILKRKGIEFQWNPKMKMRGYGLPRSTDIAQPDVVDIQVYGRASHIGQIPKKCGVFKPLVRNNELRRATRRIYKHIERASAKKQIVLELLNNEN